MLGVDGIEAVHVSEYGANACIEDSYSIHGGTRFGSLFGVFDGHSGCAASFFCRSELLHYLQMYFSRGWTASLVDPLPFLDADTHFLEFSLQDHRYTDGLSGACYNVLHIEKDKIVCANAGDCRAIVGRRVHGPDGSIHYEAIELSEDHQLDTNPAERERLLSEHLDEEDVIKRSRVKGRLQPTRGLGDGFYKDKRFETARARVRAGYSQWTPPYTTAQPQIRSHLLQDSDAFVVLSSDGLFQDLNSAQVVQYVGEYLHRDKNAPHAKTASTFLIEKALLAASEYVIGRRSVENLNLSWVVNLARGSRRKVHDDLTVLVIFLDPNQAAGASSVESASSPLLMPPTLDRALRTAQSHSLPPSPAPSPNTPSKL